MAHDESKTEQASERKLEQARREGQIPISRDVVAVAALAAGLGTFLAIAPSLGQRLRFAFDGVARGAARPSFESLLPLVGPAMLWGLIPCAAAALAAAAASFAQTRGGLWPHLAAPDLSRLFHIGRLTRLVTRELLTDLTLATVKAVAVVAAAAMAVDDDFLTLGRMLLLPPQALLSALGAPLAAAAWSVLLALALAAGADLALVRFRYREKMKMTREELKRDLKEDMGDPVLRSRRRKRHREIARGRPAVEVPRADALVVNPTHVAVAIRYRRADSKAPRVTAKGKGKMAEYMRSLALSHGVPIVEDPPLARLLHRRVKVGGEIPADTYKAVAAILAFVYRVTGRQPGVGGVA